MNDLWKYSDGEWTWESGSQSAKQNGVYGTRGIAAPGNVPPARYGAVAWIDPSGDVWLFGGDGPARFLNDLWKYANGQWTWMSGSSQVDLSGVCGVRGIPSPANVPGSREQAIGWTDVHGNLGLFGGNGFDSVGEEALLNDLWEYSNGQWTRVSGADLVDQSATYGTQGVLAPGNVPGARLEQCGWIDLTGDLWLFGGYSETTGGQEGHVNDLWMYMP
jgi:Galactose oxidase, central domain